MLRKSRILVEKKQNYEEENRERKKFKRLAKRNYDYIFVMKIKRFYTCIYSAFLA